MLVFSLAVFFEPAEAKKSSGNPLTEITSKKVCGVQLCDEPQSIEEKIAAFLESKSKGEGGAEQQIGRFSEGGVSQQKFDLLGDSDSVILTLDEEGKYNDDLLKISITPNSFWELSVLGDTEDSRIILFMSKSLDFQTFPPFFSIMKIQDSEISSKIVSESSFEEMFVKELTQQFSFIEDVSKIDITQSSLIIFEDKVQGEISGQILLETNGQRFPISFSTVVLFTSDGKTFAFSFYSSPEDFSNSLVEFNNSIQTISVESKTTFDSEPETLATPEPTPAPKSEPTQAPTAEPTPAPIAEPTPAPKSEPTPAPKAEPTPAPKSEPTQAPIAESSPAPKSEPTQIPEWIKNNANWWATNQIEDQDFTLGIEFMIKNEIINIPDSQKSVNTSTEKKSQPVIPDWIKNNALWWSQDLITENDFVKGLEWLIAQGIIVV